MNLLITGASGYVGSQACKILKKNSKFILSIRGFKYSESMQKNIFIHHKNGTYSIEELQIPNKRRMRVKDLLNGYKFDYGLKLAY